MYPTRFHAVSRSGLTTGIYYGVRSPPKVSGEASSSKHLLCKPGSVCDSDDEDVPPLQSDNDSDSEADSDDVGNVSDVVSIESRLIPFTPEAAGDVSAGDVSGIDLNNSPTDNLDWLEPGCAPGFIAWREEFKASVLVEQVDHVTPMTPVKEDRGLALTGPFTRDSSLSVVRAGVTGANIWTETSEFGGFAGFKEAIKVVKRKSGKVWVRKSANHNNRIFRCSTCTDVSCTQQCPARTSTYVIPYVSLVAF